MQSFLILSAAASQTKVVLHVIDIPFYGGPDLIGVSWSRALYLTFGVGTSLMLAVSGWLFTSGEIAADYMVGMVLFAFDLFVSNKSYYGQMTRLTVTAASLDRIEEVFAAKELKDEGDLVIAKKTNENTDSVIEYSNVCFGCIKEYFV